MNVFHDRLKIAHKTVGKQSNGKFWWKLALDPQNFQGQNRHVRTVRTSGAAKLLALMLLLTLPAAVQAQGFKWTTNTDGTLSLAAYTGTSNVVTVPSMVLFRKVTGIGAGAFSPFDVGASFTTSVTIPDTVTSIGGDAFDEDQSLANVTIPDSVTNIGATAFWDCPSLTSITIPSGVTSIGDETFYYCQGLTNITWTSNITSIGNDAFTGTGLTSITIPNSVTNIGSGAFSQSGLTSITIPSSLTGIADSAFQSCGNLTNVTIGTNLTSIGNGAFSQSGLTSIAIPRSVTNIGSGAFGECTSLIAITVDTNNVVYSSSDGALFDKNQATLIQYPGRKIGNAALPDSVTNIEAGAFESCSFLTGITIPSGVTAIESVTFSGCGDLTTVTLGTNITSIGNDAFSGTGLTSIAIPNSVTNIGSGAFGECANLTAITVDANNVVYSSSDGALFDKNQTTLLQYPNGKVGNFSLPDTVTSVGLQFEGLTNLTALTIPDSVTSISTYAFYQCDGLTNVTIGNGVTSIGLATFSECHNLVWVTIGTSVNYIGVAAFEFNGSPMGIFFRGGPPQFNLPAFYGDGSVTFYYLPGAVGWSPQVLGSANYDGFPVVPWNPQVNTSDGSFGVRNNQFGFTVTGATNIPIVVEGCTNLVNASWTALQSWTLTNGSIYFSDAQWANYPARFYRLCPP